MASFRWDAPVTRFRAESEYAMISQEMFFKLFTDEFKTIAAGKGVGNVDTERIVRIFQEAMKNPYMDERQIYRRIAEGGVESEHEEARARGD